MIMLCTMVQLQDWHGLQFMRASVDVLCRDGASEI